MKKINFILIIIALASCSHQGAMLSNQDFGQEDSSLTRIAVLPILQSLPIYYAERTGILGSQMCLKRYNAQMDIDTAITNKHVDIAQTDIIKAIQLCEKQNSVTSIWSYYEPMSLVALKGKRVSKVKQMKEKMIAISRLSISDYWCDKMVDTSEVNHQDFYRPQVNDIKLRADMLRTGLIDAAILPEPYAQWMVSEGHIILKSTSQKDPQIGTWIICTDSIEDSKIKVLSENFIRTYKQAVKEINEGLNQETIKEILSQEYGLPSTLIDTLKLPIISEGRPHIKGEVDEAMKWLTERNHKLQKTNADSLIYQP